MQENPYGNDQLLLSATYDNVNHIYNLVVN